MILDCFSLIICLFCYKSISLHPPPNRLFYPQSRFILTSFISCINPNPILQLLVYTINLTNYYRLCFLLVTQCCPHVFE